MQQKTALRYFIAFFSLLLFGTNSFSQQKTITGKVMDANKAPVVGATVLVKGSDKGVSTTEGGNFSISVPSTKATLVISFVGLETVEIPASRGDFNITLTDRSSSLNEVIVTGYSTQVKKDITGSVSVVNTKELVANPGSNVESLLQGRAAGVTVGTSGIPGAGSNVRIHGYSTFGNNEPLYVVDGTRVTSISDLNPGDIESMQVLKDASAASIYGSAAAGGLIIITTKKGKNGAPRVTYDAYYGRQTFTKRLDLLNTKEYGDYLFLLQKNAGQLDAQGQFAHGQYAGPTGKSTTPIIPAYIYAGGGQPGGKTGGIAEGDPAADAANYRLNLFDVNGPGTYQIVRANPEGTDWLGAILQKAPMQNHQIGVSGGSENANYLFGLDYFDQKGIVYTTGYKRYSVRANTSFKIKQKIRIGEFLTVNYIDRSGTNAFTNQDEGNPISFSYREQPIIPVFDIKGNYAGTRGSNLGNANNPYSNLDRRKDAKDRRIGIIGSVFVEADFLRYFTFRSNVGMDYGNNSNYVFLTPVYENAEGRGGNGQFNEGQGWSYLLTWYNTLSFRKTFRDIHDIKAMVGTEIVQDQGRSISGNTTDYFNFDRNFWQIGATLNPTPFGTSSEYIARKYSPVIAKIDYAYRDKYLLSASFRRDGSSEAFGPKNKYGNFPAFSLGWRLSSEPFFQKFTAINDLKVRFGYGVLGNDNINSYGFLTSFVTNNDAVYPINGSNTSITPGVRHLSIANPDVKWEETATTTLGIDATLLNNKVAISLDLYNRETTDLLFEKELDPSLYGGRIATQPVNIGSMNNKGIDLALSYRGTTKDFRYDASMTFSLYRNKVGKLADPFFEGDRQRIEPFNRSVTGKPLSSFFGYQLDGFYDDAAELATQTQAGKFIGGWKYKDLSGPNGKPDGIITIDDRTFIGNPHPDFIMGFNLNLAYKNFDFTSFLYWKAGGDLANYTRYWTDFNTFQGGRDRRVLQDSWTPERKDAKLPQVNANDRASGTVPVSYFIEPGGYLRLRNLSIGYTIPSASLKRFGLDRLRFYAQAQNLFTITKYTGLDPEITTNNTGRGDYRRRLADRNLGVDVGNYPTPKAYIFGINVGF
jgi:TonB-linked SusC/RagA family outer membrane protein